MRGFLQAIMAVMLVTAFAMAADDIADSRRNAIVRSIEKVAPAVVTINVVQIRTEGGSDPFFDLFNYGRPQVRQRAVEGIGSGFVFDEQGHILTNYHVLQDADAIASVTLPGGKRLDVEVVGADERSDLAVLKVKGDTAGLPHAVLGDSESLLIGEWVIAIGNPFGNMMRDPQPSVSVGVVSANHRRVSREVGGGDRLYQDLIQTDAAINPGNSGGPLVNARGEVVGINTMIFSNSGGYQGLGFSIPIARVKRVVDEIIRFGHRRDPWFGFKGQALAETDPNLLHRLGVQTDSGVLVIEILKTSPAFKAGLAVGDVVVAVNGQPVEHPSDVDFVNWTLFIGDPVIFEVERQGQRKEIKAIVAEVPR